VLHQLKQGKKYGMCELSDKHFSIKIKCKILTAEITSLNTCSTVLHPHLPAANSFAPVHIFPEFILEQLALLYTFLFFFVCDISSSIKGMRYAHAYATYNFRIISMATFRLQGRRTIWV
jgi:hypothetical protein